MDNPTSPNPVNRNQQQGTGFTNLSRIIGANQNNGLSNAVGGGLQNQANQVKTGIQSSSNQTQQDTQKQNLATDENKQKVQTIINDPTKATDSDVTQFGTFRAGRYDGPTELENKQNLQNQATQTQTLGGMAGSQAGRQGLLQRFVGGANYGQGKQRLDSAILGQTGGNQIQQAARDTRGLGQQLNQADTAAQSQANLVANQNKQFADQTKSSLNAGVQGIQLGADNAINQFNYTRDNLLNGISAAGKYDPTNPNNATLNAEQYNALVKSGYDPNDTLNLYNLNLGDYVQRSDFNPTLSSALDQTSASKAAALAKLSGNDLSEQGKLLAQAAGDTANIGTLSGQQAIKFNQDQFKQAQDTAIENEIKQFYNQSKRDGVTDKYSDQSANSYVPNADALIAGLKNGTLSTQALQHLGGLNLANTSLKNDTFNLNAGDIGDPHRYDSGATEYTKDGGQANLLTYLKNLQGTQNYYQNDLGFGGTGNGLVGGSDFTDYNKQFGALRSILGPQPETPAVPADPASLVGDNSANAALKAKIAQMTGA